MVSKLSPSTNCVSPKLSICNIDYVYGFFSDKKGSAVKRYRSFVKNGLSESRQPDLSGGGLARSAGGWTEL